MRRADISIAMATYNGSRFLAEQIQSLADQTVPPMELVVADDGSTDGTLELLERLRDGVPFPIRVLKPVGHVGYVQGFLRAARECRGSAIAYCDQDDVWKREKLEHCLSFLAKPEVMLVVHAGLTVSETLEPLGGHFPAIRRTQILPPRSVAEGALPTFPLGFALVFRREVRDAVLPRLSEYPTEFAPWFGHEMPMVLAARGLGRIVFLNEELVLYRRHGANFTSGSGIRPREVGTMLKQGADEYRDFAQHARLHARFLRYLADQDPAPPADYFRRLAGVRDKLAGNLEARAAIYEVPKGSRRMKELTRLVMGGAYRARHTGGLGARSLAKDLLTGLR